MQRHHADAVSVGPWGEPFDAILRSSREGMAQAMRGRRTPLKSAVLALALSAGRSAEARPSDGRGRDRRITQGHQPEPALRVFAPAPGRGSGGGGSSTSDALFKLIALAAERGWTLEPLRSSSRWTRSGARTAVTSEYQLVVDLGRSAEVADRDGEGGRRGEDQAAAAV